jgi:hypothetical protein
LQLPSQKKIVKELLSLPRLEVFSLSYNRLLDPGLVFCLDTLLSLAPSNKSSSKGLPSSLASESKSKSRLKVLDMAHIFASQKSEEAIVRLLQSPSLSLELFMLQGIVLSFPQSERILSRAAESENIRQGHHSPLFSLPPPAPNSFL